MVAAVWCKGIILRGNDAKAYANGFAGVIDSNILTVRFIRKRALEHTLTTRGGISPLN